jgi:hypothetical protein
MGEEEVEEVRTGGNVGNHAAWVRLVPAWWLRSVRPRWVRSAPTRCVRLSLDADGFEFRVDFFVRPDVFGSLVPGHVGSVSHFVAEGSEAVVPTARQYPRSAWAPRRSIRPTPLGHAGAAVLLAGDFNVATADCVGSEFSIRRGLRGARQLRKRRGTRDEF